VWRKNYSLRKLKFLMNGVMKFAPCKYYMRLKILFILSVLKKIINSCLTVVHFVFKRQYFCEVQLL